MTPCAGRHVDELVDAERGEVCGRCSDRLRDNLGAREQPDGPHGLAWAFGHLVAAHPLVATAAPASGGRGGSDVEDAEAERLANVLVLRDDIVAIARSWVSAVGDRTGLAGPTRLTVRDCQWWLLRNIASVESHYSVRDLLDETSELLGRAHALAPWREPPSRLRGIPCRCGVTALLEHRDGIRCWACGENYTRDQYTAMLAVLAERYGRKAG